MKTHTALLVSALLLLFAAARADDAPLGFKSSFIAGDLGFTVTNDYIVRGGIALCGSGRKVTFLAVNCKLSRLEITSDTIQCHIAGHWSPSSPAWDEGDIVFTITNGRNDARWKALCAEFQKWRGTNTLCIQCQQWCMRQDNGLLMFDDAAKIHIGSEQLNLIADTFPSKGFTQNPSTHNAALLDRIVRKHNPLLAMGGSAGWRMHCERESP